MNPESLDTLSIELDPQNPRLRAADASGKDQRGLMEIMANRFKLEELAESIIASGFLSFDPLVGYRAGSVVRVREGNRRIATLQLLLDPTRAPERKRSTWDAFSLRLSSERKEALKKVDMQVYDDPDNLELEAYIGFRHVNGVMEWGAQEKAKFIVRLVDVHSWSYKQIAERLGSFPKHVERHYIAHQIIAEAAAKEVPGAAAMKIGVLLRALQASGIADFLGVTYPSDPEASRTPIDAGHEDALKDFVKWTFGTEEHAAVLPDSRQLTQFGKILQSSEALRYLRTTTNPTFARAWVKSGGEQESVVDSLFIAADRLEEAVPLAPQHKDQEDVAAAVKRCATFMALLLPYFPDAKAALGVRDA